MRKRILLLSAATLALSAFYADVSVAALSPAQKMQALSMVNEHLRSKDKSPIDLVWIATHKEAVEAAFERSDWSQVNAAFGITPPAATPSASAAPAPAPTTTPPPAVATLPSTTPPMVRTTSSASGSTHDGSGSVDGADTGSTAGSTHDGSGSVDDADAGSTAGSTHDGSGSVDGSGVDLTEGHTTPPAAAAPVPATTTPPAATPTATPPAAATTTPASPRSTASLHSTTSSATSSSPDRGSLVSLQAAEGTVHGLRNALSSFNPRSTDGTSNRAAFLRKLNALKTQLEDEATRETLVDATQRNNTVRKAVNKLTVKVNSLVTNRYQNAAAMASPRHSAQVALTTVSTALVARADS